MVVVVVVVVVAFTSPQLLFLPVEKTILWCGITEPDNLDDISQTKPVQPVPVSHHDLVGTANLHLGGLISD